MPLLLQSTGLLALAVLAACLAADEPPPSPPSSSGPDEPTTADEAEVATAPGAADLGPLPPLKIDPGLRRALLQALTKLEEEAQQQLAEEERQQGPAELVQPSASGVPGSAPASGPGSSLQVTSRGTSGAGGDFNYFTSPGGRPTAEAREQQPAASSSTTTTTTTTTSTTPAPPPALPRNHRPESEPARPPPFVLPSSPLPTAATLLSQPPSASDQARPSAGEDIRSNVIPSSSSSLSQQKPVVTSQVVKSVSTTLPSAPGAANATKPEVAIFQAPLVAAFTLHHDLSGLPQSVEPLLESPVPSPLAFQQQLLAVHQRHVFLKQQRQKIEELERQRQLLAQQRAEQERQRQLEEQQLRLQLELQRQRQLQQQQLLELHRQRQLLEAQRLRQQQQLEAQVQAQRQLELQAQRQQQQQQQLFLGQQPPPVQQQQFFSSRPALQGFRSQRQERPSATANPGLVDVLPSVGAELKPPPPPINNNNNNNNAGQFRGFSPALSQRLPAFLPTPSSPQQQVRPQQQQLQAGTSPVLTRQPPDASGSSQNVLIQQSVPFSLPALPQPQQQDVSFQQLGGFQAGPQVFRPQRQQPPPAFGFRPLSPQYYDTITPALQSLQRQQQQQQQQQFRPRPGLLQNNLLPGALREDIDIVSKVLSLNHQRRNGTAEQEEE